jgi:hypothetical protein
MMKKSTLKFAIQRETLRVLATIELIPVAGGEAQARLLGTEGPNTTCVQVAAKPAKS